MMKFFESITMFLLILAAIGLNAQSTYCTNDNRFSEVDHFMTSDLDSAMNQVYATAVNVNGVMQDLAMDIYYPKASVDTFSQRPFVMLIHGGGFVGGNKAARRSDCRMLARRGFVTATMSYRLGFDASDPTGQVKAIYRAHQDAHAAMRFIVENQSTYSIDTSWLFMGGTSAGAVTSLTTQYTSQSDWSIILPGVQLLLGPINTSGNSLTHDFDLRAIYNRWGLVSMVGFDVADMIPMVAMHGANDQTVNIDSSSNTYGSRVIYTMLSENNVCADLSVNPNGGHGVYSGQFNNGRASCFFKSLFCEECIDFYSEDRIEADCSNGILSDNQDIHTDQTHIELFPNPVVDHFTLRGNLDEYTFEIHDASGNLYQSISTYGSSYTIDASQLPIGVFFIRAQNKLTQQLEMITFLKE